MGALAFKTIGLIGFGEAGGILGADLARQATVRVYDTAQLGSTEAYLRAQLDGADFIVGPLFREEVDAVAQAYWNAGVRHIVALRGDPASGAGQRYEPHDGGYVNAAELVAGLKKIANFEISVAGYPEKHPESPTLQADMDNLMLRKAAMYTMLTVMIEAAGIAFDELEQ